MVAGVQQRQNRRNRPRSQAPRTVDLSGVRPRQGTGRCQRRGGQQRRPYEGDEPDGGCFRRTRQERKTLSLRRRADHADAVFERAVRADMVLPHRTWRPAREIRRDPLPSIEEGTQRTEAASGEDGPGAAPDEGQTEGGEREERTRTPRDGHRRLAPWRSRRPARAHRQMHAQILHRTAQEHIAGSRRTRPEAHEAARTAQGREVSHGRQRMRVPRPGEDGGSVRV